jgi:hypothetical protein
VLEEAPIPASMASNQPTVSELFQLAQKFRRDRPTEGYGEVKKYLIGEFKGRPFPSTALLTIPEQDARAPEEDWTAGLPLVLRGIQQEDWNGIIDGIILSLEQTEGFDTARGGDARGDWHDRSRGIREETQKTVGKWMPEELMNLAEQSTRKR